MSDDARWSRDGHDDEFRFRRNEKGVIRIQSVIVKRWLTALWLGVEIACLEGCCSHGIAKVVPGRFALLPTSKAAEMLEQCSRPVPETEGTWDPSGSDVAQLEADLPRLVGQKAKGCCIQGERLREIDSYFRQYVGVVVRGRRMIYINAFPATEFDDWPPQVVRPDWKREPFKACDGGSSFWGALYDPSRRKFLDLSFNGIA